MEVRDWRGVTDASIEMGAVACANKLVQERR
jgi:hypothetical protein